MKKLTAVLLAGLVSSSFVMAEKASANQIADNNRIQAELSAKLDQKMVQQYNAPYTAAKTNAINSDYFELNTAALTLEQFTNSLNSQIVTQLKRAGFEIIEDIATGTVKLVLTTSQL